MLPTQKLRHPGGHRTPHGADPWGITGKPAPFSDFYYLYTSIRIVFLLYFLGSQNAPLLIVPAFAPRLQQYANIKTEKKL